MTTKTWTRIVAIAAATGVGAAAALVACHSEPEFPETPTPDAGVQPPPVVVADAAPPPPTTTGCDGVQQAAFSSIFAGRLATEAAKMEPEGGVVCGVVPEGGVVTGPSFFLQPGYCYTVLGNSLPNVSEVDLSLLADLTAAGVPPAFAALANAPLAVDSDTGAMAAIGAKTCYKWPWPFPGAVKLAVKARVGGGAVGAQVYKKKG